MAEAEYVNFIKEETDLDREAGLYSLEHYGVDGQKWGIRRGPPYPLGSAKTSTKRQKKKTDINKKLSENRDHSNKLKKIAIAGGITLGVGLLAYGAYKTRALNKGRDLAKFLKKSGSIMVKDLPDSSFPLKKEKVKETMSSVMKDIKSCNPLKGNTNCQGCVVAYDLRRRGFDVHAGISSGNRTGFNFQNINLWYKNPDVKAIFDTSSAQQSYSSLVEALKKQGDGARGMVCGVWANDKTGNGHAVAYQMLAGKLHFLDPQTGTEYADGYKDLISKFKKEPILYARLDNLEIDPEWIQEVLDL